MGLACVATAGAASAPVPSPIRNVFLITADGLRWEEVFRGAEDFPLTKELGNSGNAEFIRREFGGETREARRRALMPFLWSTVAGQGQLWGNRDLQSHVRVGNGHNFSYPGYNEFLTGIADPKIDSNDKRLNENTNVFEWLNARDAYRGRVAASVNWDVLPWILNAPRGGFAVWSGWEVPEGTQRLPVPEALTDMAERSRTVWPNVLLDTFVGYAARHAVQTLQPRALYVSFGETDDWAHEGHYERYLRAAHAFDRFVGELWTLAQSLPQYRDATAFLITVDHGRGAAPVAWKNHGQGIPESAYIWFAALGPGIAPLGERQNTPPLRQAQVAATVAGLLGEDFHGAMPRSAPSFHQLLREAAP